MQEELVVRMLLQDPAQDARTSSSSSLRLLANAQYTNPIATTSVASADAV